jgi:hypothetical protein
MDWTAWGPTIVSIITCIFFAGVLWAQQSNTEKRVTLHDTQLDDHTRDLTNHAIEIGKLQAFHEGYAAARSVYGKVCEKVRYEEAV